MLEERPEVDAVRYPGLPSHPQHELAQRQMAVPGGLLTFDLAGGLDAGTRFVESVRDRPDRHLARRARDAGDPSGLDDPRQPVARRPRRRASRRARCASRSGSSTSTISSRTCSAPATAVAAG
ncbi:MAG: PLP-dependent transferase [Acidimicrobiia bacterium]|nr:PLP-dependent transferase [Acidimicrobiia bacterium]